MIAPQKKTGFKRKWVLALCLPILALVFFVGWAMYCTGIAKPTKNKRHWRL
ncbi:MAG: hypothetical protein WC325_09505 [Candidatus Bathyarchaeia archaeon]